MSADRLYDSTLEMFVEAPREPDLARLAFLRWLGVRGLLEPEVFGPSSGPFVKGYAVQQVAELPLAS